MPESSCVVKSETNRYRRAGIPLEMFGRRLKQVEVDHLSDLLSPLHLMRFSRIFGHGSTSVVAGPVSPPAFTLHNVYTSSLIVSEFGSPNTCTSRSRVPHKYQTLIDQLTIKLVTQTWVQGALFTERQTRETKQLK